MKKTKIIGLAAMIAGIAVTTISNWVQSREMEETIEEKVNEALSEREMEES